MRIITFLFVVFLVACSPPSIKRVATKEPTKNATSATVSDVPQVEPEATPTHAPLTVTIIGACNIRPAAGDTSGHVAQVTDGAELAIIGDSVGSWQRVQIVDDEPANALTGWANFDQCKTQ